MFLLWEVESYECNQVLKGNVLPQCSQILRMFAVLADTVSLLSFFLFVCLQGHIMEVTGCSGNEQSQKINRAGFR